jgi:diaminopimelate dehydrogenase
MKEKIKIAVVGYGNVGKSAVQAVQEEPDMELVGVVELVDIVKSGEDIKIVKKISELSNIDVAIICTPSITAHQLTEEIISSGINTVDSFDIHAEILGFQKKLDITCKANKKVAIISAGWDPGIDSIIRALFLAMAPKGITHTNFGPGMSMGHTCAAKAIKGVKDALSITVPVGLGLHKRVVYVELDGKETIDIVEGSIKKDPYFIKNETVVIEVKDISRLMSVSHSVVLERNGVSGTTHNQMFKYECKANNPALTSQIMVSSARAVTRQEPGCYTVIDIPIKDFLSEDRDSLINSLV